MADERTLRRKAAFEVAKRLADPEIRRQFAAHGHRSGDTVVAALESDTIDDVYAKMRRQSPPVTVGIYWPETGRLEFTTFEPDQAPSVGQTREGIGGAATIGMLFDHVSNQQGNTLRLNLAWGAAASMHVERFTASLT
ncbi:hypothetical protein [Streptomyces lavendofoliae]|uniref:Uncharacterized protein n=1 Tax=Streptomyces lavendofoliae TaxID=67314 RepID=A0A918M7Q3_9ACTN|nr:hypothetical protein [Streptomyces lavendofoliae]GGU68896.1 hypothetical protein GCM10010274_66370 [Streptomyces lavendofoliae]